MPFLPIRRRDPGHAHSRQFDELLENGADPTSDAAWQRVSEVFGPAAADPTPAELTVDSAALAAFRRAHLSVPTRRHLVRSNMITTLLSSKIAGAIACAAIAVTGAAGAAYANVLPPPIQNIAHDTIGAPPTRADSDRHGGSGHDVAVALASASASLSPTLTPSPSASASVTAARLCDEWPDVAERSSDDGATNVHDQLAALAGGVGNIAAFCATVGADGANDEHHSASATPSPTATTSAADDQRDDHLEGQGDDHGRDGASASASASASAQSPSAQSPSKGSDNGDGSGKDNSGTDDGSGDQSDSGNNGSGNNGDH
jgi:hypothetical protein